MVICISIADHINMDELSSNPFGIWTMHTSSTYCDLFFLSIYNSLFNKQWSFAEKLVSFLNRLICWRWVESLSTELLIVTVSQFDHNGSQQKISLWHATGSTTVLMCTIHSLPVWGIFLQPWILYSTRPHLAGLHKRASSHRYCYCCHNWLGEARKHRSFSAPFSCCHPLRSMWVTRWAMGYERQ